jgi:hypothetical protein
MKIATLGAMLEEVSCIEKLMEVSNRQAIGAIIYIEGTILNTEVVLTFYRC